MIREGDDDEGHSFGDRVRISRERMRTAAGRRWTQGDLAKALDVKRNTVSRWENGGMLPKDPAIIAALTRVLHVSADWLLAGFAESAAQLAVEGVHDQPDISYGDESLRAESLPPVAADVVLRYLERLAAIGCPPQQVKEAERTLVTGARNRLARRPFSQRDIKDVIADIDASWDFVTRVLRRQGMRP
ncbi:MAG TPA: helix-turn-helix transcriptional regulator [Gemmatimonadaceae bacterium]|jgi:transcriptional regulator with XRE-family HTH domain|nr:helix-turn-helix transcriptional regulator [Gemmatimonadaceae bacterium]